MPQEASGELYRARPIESYDCASLRGSFPSGINFAVAVTHASRVLRPFQLKIEGTEGWALLSCDGDRLETSDGLVIDTPETTQDLIHRCYERLALRVRNAGARTATRLEDTLPYVRTTNAMYLSSGGIHDVDRAFVQTYLKDGCTGYHLEGICDAMDRVMADGELFSELDVPWAVAKPRPVALDSFDVLDLTAEADCVIRNQSLAVG
jgi:hypothetical protein